MSQLIVVTDRYQLTYSFVIPKDERFALFRNGFLINDGDEFVFGPAQDQVTLAANPEVGDTLDFRSL